MRPVSKRTLAAYDGLLREIATATELARQPDKCAARADAVSHWSIQQQLDHLLKSDAAILEGLHRALASEAPVEPGGPSFMGRLVLWTGFIPRGKGKAPESVLPSDRSPAEIAAGFDETRGGFESLQSSLAEIERSRATVPHPILGRLNAVQWLRFARLHHRHHHRIIRDILRSAERDDST
jgi:hypothetical protein